MNKMFADPKEIIVKRAERQRREISQIASLKDSILKQGQIQPIVVRKEGDTLILVAGERRLRACTELGIEVRYELIENLTPLRARELELEENLKREDLPWRDQVRSIAELHNLHKAENEAWTTKDTALEISITPEYLYVILFVASYLDAPVLKDAVGIKPAFALLQRQSERRVASVLDEIASQSAQVFAPSSAPEAQPASAITQALAPPAQAPMASMPRPVPGSTPQIIGTPAITSSTPVPQISVPQTPPLPPTPTLPVLNVDFFSWLSNYNGPKFNLIHCDFPFGIKFTTGYGQEEDGIKYDSTEEDYWKLVDALCVNTHAISSYSSHLVFWFSMTFYEETKRRLRAAGWKVQDHPLIWYKSDGQGIVPGRNEYPRRVYESALLASRGSRPLVKMADNCYAAPRATGSFAIHPSQKPEPVLRHFLSAVVDNTTDLLDPTCGSGTALRAAEDVGARSVLGLELNADFAKAANAATLNARNMRKVSR